MKRNEISIRDPYVLLHNGKYYLYGTRSATCWGPADGFDCYVSPDLREFEGPIEIFHRPDGFFADRCYWAPECTERNGSFFLLTTFGAPDRKKGAYILKADRPEGPFEPYSGLLTPPDWTCIDATLFFEDGTPYVIFSHSFEDPGSVDGDYCLMRLTEDLLHAASEPVILFSAKSAPWAKPVPFAKQEFGIDGDCYFSDGPNVLAADDGTLYMIFSSWSTAGYAVGAAVSESGRIAGPWKLQEQPLFPENGGHGMFFRDRGGRLVLTLHYPNDRFSEHPAFWRILTENGCLKLGEPL